MTDQDEDKDQDPGKLGSKPADHSADVEGHASPEAPTVEDDDDVEGHFGSIRPTGSKGE
jgi:hypothetical protein